VAYLAGGAAAAVGVAGAVAVRSSPRTGALRAVHAA